jgi:hypothetical protein
MAPNWSDMQSVHKLDVLEKDKEGDFIVRHSQTENTCVVADTFAEKFTMMEISSEVLIVNRLFDILDSARGCNI